MRAYSLYICDRSKVCLFHKDWLMGLDDQKDHKNSFITLYGLFFQMKLFTTAADPTKAIGDGPDTKPDGMRPTCIGEGTSFRSICTNTYQLNFFEAPSGIKFVLITTPKAQNVHQLLTAFFKDVYIRFVVRDAACLPGEQIVNPAFSEAVEAFLSKHGYLG